MMVDEFHNEARALGIDVTVVDAIVRDVWDEALGRPDGDHVWRQRTIRERWRQAMAAAFLGDGAA